MDEATIEDLGYAYKWGLAPFSMQSDGEYVLNLSGKTGVDYLAEL